MADVRILLISGSTRRGSGNTAALRTVQALAPDGVTAELYDGLAALPAFSPDQDERPPDPAADLRARIAAAGALLFCTPEYAGTLPGSLKNLLDWTVGGGEIYGKPVGWINVAVGGRGTGAAARGADHGPADTGVHRLLQRDPHGRRGARRRRRGAGRARRAIALPGLPGDQVRRAVPADAHPGLRHRHPGAACAVVR